MCIKRVAILLGLIHIALKIHLLTARVKQAVVYIIFTVRQDSRITFMLIIFTLQAV